MLPGNLLAWTIDYRAPLTYRHQRNHATAKLTLHTTKLILTKKLNSRMFCEIHISDKKVQL